MSSQSISLYNNLLAKKRFKKIVNFDLKRMRLALKKLGNPERNLKNVINILGSDGKFSVLNSLKYFIEENNNSLSKEIHQYQTLKETRQNQRIEHNQKLLSLLTTPSQLPLMLSSVTATQTDVIIEGYTTLNAGIPEQLTLPNQQTPWSLTKRYKKRINRYLYHKLTYEKNRKKV